MKTRYRSYKPLFGKQVLVLQVGIEGKLGNWSGYDPTDLGGNPPSWNPEEVVVSWRDAKTEDLMDILKEDIID